MGVFSMNLKRKDISIRGVSQTRKTKATTRRVLVKRLLCDRRLYDVRLDCDDGAEGVRFRETKTTMMTVQPTMNSTAAARGLAIGEASSSQHTHQIFSCGLLKMSE